MRALAPFVLLLGYGVAFGAAALGTSLIAFDDHPGQLYRVWHVVTRGWAPWAWNPGWWAGYPELQFYPPAFAAATALLHHVTLGTLPVPAAYQAMVWVAYLAPGATTFLALGRVLGNGWLALPGAFVALTLSAGVASGVEGGVRWGMVSARLGWALLPLVALGLVRWREGRRTFPAAMVVLLAAIVLLHPAHLPTAVAMVVLAAVADRRRPRIGAAGLGLVMAAALTAVWTVPLLARLDNARALAWGALATPDLLRQPLVPVLIALALVALARRPDPASPGRDARWPSTVVVTHLPLVTAAIVLADALIVERLGIRWLPADRVVDGAWLALVLAAGMGLGAAVAWTSARWRLPLPALSLAAVAVLVVVSLPARSLTLWPRALDWPTYPAIARGLRLDDLWRALRTLPDGRVLFVRSGVPLVYGDAWYRPHTHVTALTPVAGGRAIVHGTFTHPSPVAALVYRGSAGRGPITRLAEQLDGRLLFGHPLAELDSRTFQGYADPLAISAVVALDEDAPALRGLVDAGALQRRTTSPPFVVYGRGSGVELPREVERDRWRVSLAGPAGAWVSARVAYYPLWRAVHEQAPLPVRRGAMGNLEVQLPRERVTVDLVYAAGWPEWTGLAISLLAVLAWLGLVFSPAIGMGGPSRPPNVPSPP